MPELLGRERDLHQLTELWADAQRGYGSIVIVSAEAGGGKTALLAEFTSSLAEPDVVRWGECIDGDGGPPFGPWTSILPGPVTASLLTDAQSEVRRFESFATATQALVREEGPSVVIIDDLHWADGATLRLLEFLAPSIAKSRCLLLLATRPTTRPDLQATFGALTRRGAIRLELRSLSAKELETLIPDAGEAARIARLTGGNPMFVVEYARHLSLGGDPDRTPDSLASLVQVELRRLTNPARQAAKVAALIDGAIYPDVLAAAGASDADLDELVSSRLLADREGAFRWRHDALREAVHAGLSTSERQSLEATLAGVYLAKGDEFGVASHGCRAGAVWDPVRAHAAAVSSARHWASLYALEFAAGYTELARSVRRLVVLDQAEKLSLELFEGELFTRIRRDAEARTVFRDAAMISRELEDWEALARIALNFGLGHEYGSAYDPEVVSLLREATSRTPPEDHTVRARLFSRSAWQILDPGDVDDRLALAREAVREARLSEDSSALAAALLALCWGLAQPEHLAERRTAAAAALVAARDCGDIELQMGALFRLFMVSLETGDLSAARRAGAMYDDLTQRCPLPYHRWYASLFNGALALVAGDLEAAQRWADEIDPASTSQEQLAVVMRAALQGEILTLRGGAERLRGARLVHDVCEQSMGMGWVFRPRVVALESGSADARPLLRGAVQRCLQGPIDEDRLAFLAILSETAVYIGDRETCELLIEVMQPYAARWVVIANGANCRGPVWSFLAAMARVAEMGPEAEAYREQSERLIRAEDAPGVQCWLDLRPINPRMEPARSAGPLTPRESQVLALLARGHSNQEIADTLVLSIRTVQRHVENVYGRLDIHNRAEATIAAAKLGLVSAADLRPDVG